MLLTQLSGNEATWIASARGWNGDRYAVFHAADGYALVWYSVWDNDQAAAGVAALLDRNWPVHAADGRRREITQETIEGQPAVRLVDAPAHWPGWRTGPGVAGR